MKKTKNKLYFETMKDFAECFIEESKELDGYIAYYGYYEDILLLIKELIKLDVTINDLELDGLYAGIYILSLDDYGFTVEKYESGDRYLDSDPTQVYMIETVELLANEKFYKSVNTRYSSFISIDEFDVGYEEYKKIYPDSEMNKSMDECMNADHVNDRFNEKYLEICDECDDRFECEAYKESIEKKYIDSINVSEKELKSYNELDDKLDDKSNDNSNDDSIKSEINIEVSADEDENMNGITISGTSENGHYWSTSFYSNRLISNDLMKYFTKSVNDLFRLDF